MSDIRMQRYSRDAVRLMRGPHIVGMLLRRADDRWTINDAQENPLTKRTFLQANMARDYAETEGLLDG